MIPFMLALGELKKVSLNTFLLFGICIAFPTSSLIRNLFYEKYTSQSSYISNTDKQRGLSVSRFSEAINIIENDSSDSNDVLLFLPKGNMSDLILRTKMRTLSVHFAGDNLSKHNNFLTSEKIIIYCAYDSSLLEEISFKENLNKKFPQVVNREILYSERITVEKLSLNPELIPRT